MDKRDKNIEDFFNKSLEQFSDTPSDRVWAGIAQQIDAEQPPFYKRWKFWGTTFMVLALLSLLFGGYYSTQKAILGLTLKTNKLEAENQALKLALTDCSLVSSTSYSEKEQEVLNEHSTIVVVGDEVSGIDNQVVKSGGLQKASFFTPDYTANFKNSIFSNLSTEGSFSFSKTTDLFTDKQYQKALSIAATDMQNEGEWSGQKISKENIRDLTDAEITAIKKSGFHQLAKLGNQGLRARRVKTTLIRNLPSYFKDYGMLHLTEPIDRKLELRYGMIFGGMNTFTDQDDLFGPGYNSGFTSELRLSDKLSLTAGINFTSQNYEIKLNADNQSVVQNYPATSEITNIVTSINQNSRYLELPIGLKWYFKENANRTKFYVNPAVAWQFYFPQRFE